jgi:peptidoglycan/LPS O-acetylase OafA/YrhL
MLQDFPVFQVLRRLGAPDSPWFVASFGSARPFWTISIEWWIYMTFGGIMFYLVRRDGGGLGLLGLFALAVAALEPLYHFAGGPDNCLTMLWLAGMGAAVLFHRMPALLESHPKLGAVRLRRIALAIAGASVVLMTARLVNNRGSTNELQFALYLGLLLFALFFALGFAAPRVPRWVALPVGFIAGYSYSLYLVHHTLLDFVAAKRPDLIGSAAAFWALVAASNVLAVVFWVLFERHHRQFARRLKGWLHRVSPHRAGSLVRG